MIAQTKAVGALGDRRILGALGVGSSIAKPPGGPVIHVSVFT
jgi:hypothetical protein